jgi:uncharacterized protein (DUF885 family)
MRRSQLRFTISLFSLLLCSAVVLADELSPSTALFELFDREWEARLAASPQFASNLGDKTAAGQLEDLSPETLGARQIQDLAFLDELQKISIGKLTDEERIHAAILEAQLQNRIDQYRFGAHEVPFNADSSFWSSFARLPQQLSLRDAEDLEGYLDRLSAWPRLVDQQIGWMRRGLERGMTQPRVVLEGIDATIDAHVVESVEQSGFFEPFNRMPASLDAAQRDKLLKRAHQVIGGAVVPAYAELSRFMREEYVPGARRTLGAHDLPDGEAYYAQRIRHFTTLDLSAKEIHEIGLKEVARIRAEMKQIIGEVEFEGSFEEFLTFLRTDPRFYAKSAEELLKEASYISKRMDGKLPALFKTLPRMTYTVEPVPASIAPKYTAGRYVPSSESGHRPGRYWVNTYALETRPLYNLEALTLHEAVPGHHLQGALNRELEQLPNFRRYSYLSAFGEGWGLYSEWLGLEAGFYTDPYSNFGRLTYEMWRACRLVVDTGLHAFGWTRQQVMDYMASNTALSLHEIRTETDRYISWPAQALSYKMGELKIQQLRRKAESTLGDRFDVRLFHDAILESGSIPLSVLEDQIDDFIAEQQAQGG